MHKLPNVFQLIPDDVTLLVVCGSLLRRITAGGLRCDCRSSRNGKAPRDGSIIRNVPINYTPSLS